MRDYRQEDWPANEENYFLLHYHTGLVVWFFVVCLFVCFSFRLTGYQFPDQGLKLGPWQSDCCQGIPKQLMFQKVVFQVVQVLCYNYIRNQFYFYDMRFHNKILVVFPMSLIILLLPLLLFLLLPRQLLLFLLYPLMLPTMPYIFLLLHYRYF